MSLNPNTINIQGMRGYITFCEFSEMFCSGYFLSIFLLHPFVLNVLNNRFSSLTLYLIMGIPEFILLDKYSSYFSTLTYSLEAPCREIRILLSLEAFSSRIRSILIYNITSL